MDAFYLKVTLTTSEMADLSCLRIGFSVWKEYIRVNCICALTELKLALFISYLDIICFLLYVSVCPEYPDKARRSGKNLQIGNYAFILTA
jgi:hypothetical protein